MVVEKKQVICKTCGYKWKTKSKMDMVCCPRCSYKVRLKPKRKKGLKKVKK